jgi:hypothetical protein
MKSAADLMDLSFVVVGGVTSSVSEEQESIAVFRNKVNADSIKIGKLKTTQRVVFDPSSLLLRSK